MNLPFSDVPSDVLKQHLEQAFHALNEANKLAAIIDLANHRKELEKLCDVALNITMAAKDVLDQNIEDADIRVRVGLQSLSEIHLK